MATKGYVERIINCRKDQISLMDIKELIKVEQAAEAEIEKIEDFLLLVKHERLRRDLAELDGTDLNLRQLTTRERHLADDTLTAKDEQDQEINDDADCSTEHIPAAPAGKPSKTYTLDPINGQVFEITTPATQLAVTINGVRSTQNVKYFFGQLEDDGGLVWVENAFRQSANVSNS